jgi:hypothetical protein
MTLRDYFAAQALTGIIQRDAREGRYELLKDGHAPSVAYTAYCLADAMLAEREGKQ